MCWPWRAFCEKFSEGALNGALRLRLFHSQIIVFGLNCATIALMQKLLILLAIPFVLAGCDMRGDTDANGNPIGPRGSPQTGHIFNCGGNNHSVMCSSDTQYCLESVAPNGSVTAQCPSYPSNGCQARGCLIQDANIHQGGCLNPQYSQQDTEITLICRTP